MCVVGYLGTFEQLEAGLVARWNLFGFSFLFFIFIFEHVSIR